MSQPSDLSAWLDFTSKTFWPLTLLIVIFIFRADISDFMKRLTKVTYGNTTLEAEQREARDAPAPSEQVRADVVAAERDVPGFLSIEAILEIVNSSGLVQEDEKSLRYLPLFDSSAQRTWLVATRQQLFCVLDSAKTRSSGKLIQWKQDRVKALSKIDIHPYKPDVGLVDIGARRQWLYSIRLHPDANDLRDEITGLFDNSAD